MFPDENVLFSAARLLAASGYNAPVFMMDEDDCRLSHLHELTVDFPCPLCGFYKRCTDEGFCPHCIKMEYERAFLAWLIHLAILAGELDAEYFLHVDSYDSLPYPLNEYMGTGSNEEQEEAEEVDERKKPPERPWLLE